MMTSRLISPLALLLLAMAACLVITAGPARAPAHAAQGACGGAPQDGGI